MWEREQSEKMCVAWDFVPVICWKKYIYPLLVQWVYTSRILMSSRGAAILLYSLIIFTIFALPTPHSIFESKLAHFFYYITFACVERLLVYKRHVIIYIYIYGMECCLCAWKRYNPHVRRSHKLRSILFPCAINPFLSAVITVSMALWQPPSPQKYS